MEGLTEHGQGVLGERPYPGAPGTSGGHDGELIVIGEQLGIIAASLLQVAQSQRRTEEIQRRTEEKVMASQDDINQATAQSKASTDTMNAALAVIQGEGPGDDTTGLVAATAAETEAQQALQAALPQPGNPAAPGLAP